MFACLTWQYMQVKLRAYLDCLEGLLRPLRPGNQAAFAGFTPLRGTAAVLELQSSGSDSYSKLGFTASYRRVFVDQVQSDPRSVVWVFANGPVALFG